MASLVYLSQVECVKTSSHISKQEFQPQLHQPWRIPASGLEKVRRLLIISRIAESAVGLPVDVNEMSCRIQKPIFAQTVSLIVAVEEIERLRAQFNAHAFGHVNDPGKTKIGGGVIGTQKRISPETEQAIIAGVVVAVRISSDTGVGRSAAAVTQHARYFPVVEYSSQNFLASPKWSRLGNP